MTYAYKVVASQSCFHLEIESMPAACQFFNLALPGRYISINLLTGQVDTVAGCSPSATPTSDIVTQYLDFKKSDGLQPSTLAGYTSSLNAFAVACPDWPPDSTAIITFLNRYRTKEYSDVTAADYRRHLNGLCRWAIDAGYLPDNPMRHVPKFTAATRDIDDRIIPTEDFEQLIAYLEHLVATTSPRQRTLPHERAIRDLAILHLTYATGGRVSEVASLRMSKLDPESYAAIVLASLTKNKKRREVYYGDQAQAAILAWLKIRPDGVAEFVFLGTRGNGWSKVPMTGSGISHLWANRQREAGIISPHRFHDLRHTHITRSLDAGIAPHHVSAQAGQDPRVTAAVYTHSRDAERRAAYTGKNPDDLLGKKNVKKNNPADLKNLPGCS